MTGDGLPTSFGALLREHRLRAGLTQEALAERAGLSVRAVQHLERELGQPQRETTRRLADALTLTAEHRAGFEQAAAPAPRRRARPATPSSSSPPATPPPATVADPDGERKRVTVLAATIDGLTDSSESFEPDLADRLLRGVMRLMVDVAHRYGGTVNWVRGDAIMVLFGAPVAHEDHAARACYAALAMHQALAAYAEQTAGEYGVTIGLRVGLDSGEVVVRTTSNDLSTGYTAIGPAVRAASRLEQIAATGATLLTGQTAQLAEGHVEIGSLGEAFVLTGPHPTQSRFQRVAQSRQLTRFVGRDAELASVLLPLRQAEAGHGQVVAVVGEPGIGKSRLVWELTRSSVAAGWHILEAGCVSYGSGTAYLPVVELVKAYAGIGARDDGAAVSEKLTTSLRALDRALEPDLLPLLALLELPVEDADWRALDPPLRRRRTLDALKRLLLRESERQPLLLVFEDLHWIDSESQALLDSLVDSLPAARMVLLVTYRPEYEHRWGRRSFYTQIRVGALSGAPAEELLDALLGDAAASHPSMPAPSADLQELKRLLIVRTEGSPFFLEESVRALVEAGTLSGERGAYRIARPLDTIGVPATVQTVLAARIDRLEPEAKRVLQLAAVIGKDVPLALLRAIADLPEAALHDAVARLQAAELLYEARLFPELEYTFTHALTHDVAYGGMLQERRRAIHARVVTAMERLDADRQAEEVERLANHALQGEVWEKALVYARLAGRKSMQHAALAQAVEHFERALVALEHLPEDRERREQAIDIRLEIRSCLYPVGQFDRIVERLREAEALATSLDDPSRLARIPCYLASCYWTMGRHDLAVESAQRALPIAEVNGDLGTRVLADHFLGLAYHGLGAYEQAVKHLRRNVVAFQGPLQHERFGMHGVLSVFSRSPLIWCLAELGEIQEALARNHESFVIAEAVRHPPTFGGVYMGVSLLHVRTGDLNLAIQAGQDGLAYCQTWGLRAVIPMVTAQLGYAHALAGRPAEGIPILARAIEETEALGALHTHALWLGWLGEALLLAGQREASNTAAARSLALARQRGQRGAEAWALRLQGEIAAGHALLADEAEMAYCSALTLAEGLGMRPLQAHCHLGLGRLYARADCPDDARTALGRAVRLLRDLGLHRWLPETEAALARLS